MKRHCKEKNFPAARYVMHFLCPSSTPLSDTVSPHPPSHIISLLGRAGLVFGERGESQIWLDDPEVREELLGLIVANTRVHNHVITGHPVDGRCHPVFIAS